MDKLVCLCFITVKAEKTSTELWETQRKANIATLTVQTDGQKKLEVIPD